MNKINTYGILLINQTGLAIIKNSTFVNNTGGIGCAIYFQASIYSSLYIFLFFNNLILLIS